MNPAFITAEGRVLDFEKPKTSTPEVKKEEESFDQMAARSAEQQSTPIKEVK